MFHIVLTRRLDEVIDLTLEDGRRIGIKVFAISSTQVKLGIEAPPSIAVYRREITEAIEWNHRMETLIDSLTYLGAARAEAVEMALETLVTVRHRHDMRSQAQRPDPAAARLTTVPAASRRKL